jgi:cation diffusion facilitator CzcD-associated flavoprotein CzcO
MAERIDIAVIGAGPYGLAVAASLRQAGREVRVFGEPLHFWRTQTPVGMFLRSPYGGTDIGDPKLGMSLPDYERTLPEKISIPIPVTDFFDYGDWLQARALPDLDRRNVRCVSRTDRGFLVEVDGETFEAARVIVAAGVGTFAFKPEPYASLSPELASHTLDHHDLGIFRGQRVAVVGRGQSATESAALLHEAGADVDLLVRADGIRWLNLEADDAGMRLAQTFLKPIVKPVLKPLLYSRFGVGPAILSQLNARPGLMKHVPSEQRGKWAYRSVRPAAAAWVHPRLEGVTIRTNIDIVEASSATDGVHLRAADGTQLTVDHVLCGTGYRVDLSKYPFLDADLVRSIDCVGGYPQLSKTFETTLPGLHIVGAPGAYTFGPLMRFVAGSAFAARSVARGLAA